MLDMNHASIAGGHVLGLEHLLLEMLAVSKLVVLDREAKSWVVVVAHAHVVLVVVPAHTGWIPTATLHKYA